ncbi:MAG: Translation initiation factor 2 [uncultured Thermomicrobiales bacterium]|uniref:Translation initiation factor IF-2 n=1 Tax=uncultured Thermomicrobiales bacterium TaxID=1645740 RepID=A0A6J4V0L1_9BACT|nr:MAG: Translation initiation factor 2 [uncultured Thermomicrobiales bacterium]
MANTVQGGVRRGGPGGRGGGRGPGGRGGRGGRGGNARTVALRRAAPVERHPVGLAPVMAVKDLGELLDVNPVEVVKELMKLGIMANVNQQIDFEMATKVATSLGWETFEAVPEIVIGQNGDFEKRKEASDADPESTTRPPVVTIMGHVDHGKTSLLDAIRSAKVAQGEAGGITQHIGAYQVENQGRKITFLDTPGHEAFTAMRSRGAQMTDVAILVVAADDGLMPTTREAIAHIKSAHVPMVVAVNKIDLPSANVDRVKQQLSDFGVMPEEWGGDVPFVEVSAKDRLGLDDLLEVILLVADVNELKANPHRPAIGTVIEARIDKNRGPIATVLVQQGTLNLRDVIVAGSTSGRIKAMFDDRGRKPRRAEPSMPVEVLGLLEVPQAGDTFEVYEDERVARAVAEERLSAQRITNLTENRPTRLNDLYNQMQDGATAEMRVILKADVSGSLGAIQTALQKLNEDVTQGVHLTVLYAGTGGISDSDVSLASATDASIIGFNVRPDAAANRAAETAGVDIRFYSVIYNLLDEVRLAMTGLLAPVYEDVTDGYAEVRDTFKLPNGDVVAGAYVLDGKILRSSKVRVLRSGVFLHEGSVRSLRRFKDDVREVATGYECGVGLESFNDLAVGDQLEFYHRQEVARVPVGGRR